MKKLSDVKSIDFKALLASTNALKNFDTAEELGQAFVNVIYEYFQNSLVLLRLFATVPYCSLSTADKQSIDIKINVANTVFEFNDRTPILTLLGTRGQNSDWNERRKSQGFRCIPLLSSEYVASLSMLASQFKNMNLNFNDFNAWEETVVAKGRADDFSGILYVKNASIDKDDQDRMVVPKQDFVTEHNVKTVLGFGSGYSNHPTLVTLFIFTNEILDKSMMEPFVTLLESYKSASKKIVADGRFFRS